MHVLGPVKRQFTFLCYLRCNVAEELVNGYSDILNYNEENSEGLVDDLHMSVTITH